MKIYLFIFLIIIQVGWLQAQTPSAEYIHKNLPTFFNNADSNIKNCIQWSKNSTNNVSVNVFCKIALHHLYNYKCKYNQANEVLDLLSKKTEFKEHPDLALAVLLTQQISSADVGKNNLQSNEMLPIEKQINESQLPSNKFLFQILLAKRNKNNANAQMKHYQSAITIAKSNNLQGYTAECYLYIAKVLLQKKSMYEQAKLYLDSAKQIAVTQNFRRLNTQIDLCKADILSHQNRFGTAIQIYEKCLNNFTQIHDVEGIVTTYKFLGNGESYLDNIPAAIQYYHQGIEMSIANNYKSLLPVLNQNIGNVYLDVNKDSAKYYLEKAIALAAIQKDEHIKALATYNLSEYYSSSNLYEKSKEKKYEALAIFTKLDENNNVSWVLPQIVELELEQIKKTGSKFTISQSKQLENMLEKALALNADGNSYVNLESIYGSYVTIAQWNQDFQTASLYQSKLLTLKDTVYKNQLIKDAIETSERLKSTEQKLKIAQLEVENGKSKIYNYSLIALTIFTIIAAFAIYQNYRKRTRLKNSKMLQQQKEQFRNQLAADLHDEVGTMLTGLAMQSEMLSFQSTENKTKELQEISTISKDAMEQMREIVWTLDSSKDKFENLFKRMKYLAEQQLHIKQIEHSFTINSYDDTLEILPEKRQNVYLIFKEAIANILKHSNATFVEILIDQTKEKTTLLIKDNGTVVKQNMTDGLGISNMQKRAKVIDAAFTYFQNNGFTVQLIF